MADASQPFAARALFYDHESIQERAIEVAVETPVSLVYGTIPHVVLMASPADIRDLVIGFSLTEGIAATFADIRNIDIAENDEGIRADIQLQPEAMRQFLSRRRNMSGRTSCGLCGIEEFSQIHRARGSRHQPPPAPPLLARALAQMTPSQPLHLRTHATHGAAWFDNEAKLVLMREDVGRHNALDKMIGAACLSGINAHDGFTVITSRCSFEMVEKAAIFGSPTIVAISAPTALAIRRAEELGVNLIAVARRDNALQFTPSPQGNARE